MDASTASTGRIREAGVVGLMGIVAAVATVAIVIGMTGGGIKLLFLLAYIRDLIEKRRLVEEREDSYQVWEFPPSSKGARWVEVEFFFNDEMF